MNFTTYSDVYKFAQEVEPFFVEHEDLYSLNYGILQHIKAGRYENPYQATIHNEGQLVAILQMTPPHPIQIVITDESVMEEAISIIIDKLIEDSVNFTAVIGLKTVASRFAEDWAKRNNLQTKISMDQGFYRLDRVTENLELSPGSWRYANEQDAPLIETWFTQFEEDANLSPTPIDEVKKRVALFLQEREVFLWEHNGKVVSMMKKARPTANGVTVSFVFTPREERKKGYARTMVAAGSQELLKTFTFCVLYTDLLNPTSNKIYQEIGYQRMADSIMIGFASK